MGRVRVPKYAVEFVAPGFHLTPAVWRGRVSEKALAKYVEAMNASFQPGGANEHLVGTRVTEARIVENTGRTGFPLRGGDVVVTWKNGETSRWRFEPVRCGACTGR